MKLTKKYRIIYHDNTIVEVINDDHSVTYVGDGNSGAEFDTEDEMNDFIANNMLKWESAQYIR